MVQLDDIAVVSNVDVAVSIILLYVPFLFFWYIVLLYTSTRYLVIVFTHVPLRGVGE